MSVLYHISRLVNCICNTIGRSILSTLTSFVCKNSKGDFIQRHTQVQFDASNKERGIFQDMPARISNCRGYPRHVPSECVKLLMVHLILTCTEPFFGPNKFSPQLVQGIEPVETVWRPSDLHIATLTGDNKYLV